MRTIVITRECVRRGAMAAVFAITIIGFGAAEAQQGPARGMMGEDGGMMMGRGGMMHEGMQGPGMMMCRMGEHVEGRLAYLKAELKITDTQAPQWNAFADAFRASAQKAMKHCAMMKDSGSKMMSAPLPERLNMMEEHLQTHLESLRAVKAAAQQLYAALNDEQKKIADQMFRGHMGMM
jgi:hypothetical protein